ncbi:MAG: ribonuclease P [Candidatus Methanomethylicota archaeon]|uniref:Ribonuclease P protein component 4 n=1 Tax=Thermoproteota archaeon TaxID=2056631 RepID=A0A497EXS8_9CREN|nr:MAG: ribonuclease P [Candidatus Verstraetearchaeota archaeon]RLE55901.1 MAG: ribonuclease P [Candidatus Verstraetearchaeota archaeon]
MIGGLLPRLIKDIAVQRIDRLFKLAESVFLSSPELANRYVALARRISMRCRVRIPKKWRRRYCHYCGAFLWPGVNCRVRIRSNRMPHVVITCFNCGRQMRFPFKR